MYYVVRELFIPFILGTYYTLYANLVDSAQFECDSSDPPYISFLCSYMAVGEYHQPTELAHFRKIRERFLGPSVDIWVLILGDWAKIIKPKPPATHFALRANR